VHIGLHNVPELCMSVMSGVQATWMYRAALTSYDDPTKAQTYFEDMQARPHAPPALTIKSVSARMSPARRGCWQSTHIVPLESLPIISRHIYSVLLSAL
jgi:hypothetical protein